MYILIIDKGFVHTYWCNAITIYDLTLTLQKTM